MAPLITLALIGIAGFAAYVYMRAVGVSTAAEERIAIVVGVALALVLQAETGAEFVAELVALTGVVLGVASLAHLAVIALAGDRSERLHR